MFPMPGNKSRPPMRIDQGPWSPTIVGSTGGGPLTYTTQFGYWWRHRNRCFLDASIIVGGGVVVTGNVSISGIPFPAITLANYIGCFTPGSWALTLGAGNTQISLILLNATSQILLQQNGTGIASSSVPAGTLGAGAVLTFSGSYLIAPN